MADTLTQAERAAIAAYRGPVTVCPPATFTPEPVEKRFSFGWQTETDAPAPASNKRRAKRALAKAKAKGVRR